MKLRIPYPSAARLLVKPVIQCNCPPSTVPARNWRRLALLAGLALALGPSLGWAQGGAWLTNAPLPTARYGTAVGVINGNIYVASGALAQNSRPFPRFTCLEVYDPVANSWTTNYAPIPTGVYACTAGVLNGQLYVAGGQADQTHGIGGAGNIADLQVYDPVANQWNLKAPMPFASGATCGGVLNGQLYVAGGSTADNLGRVNNLRVYDPGTDTWLNKSPLPNALVFAGAGIVNGQLYVVGGVSAGSAVLNAVQAYNPLTDSWTTKAPMPTARMGLAVQVLNGILYAAGGYDGSTVLPTLEAYDPVADTWTKLAPMPTARNVPGAAVAAGNLYVLGGYDNSGNLANNEAFAPFSLGLSLYAGLTLTGEVGRVYEIDYRNSLADTNWTALTTLALSNSPYLYFDTNSSRLVQRFYRAVLLH